MATLPNTGQTMTFGRTYKAYTNVPVNTSGNATDSPPYTGSKNIKLSQILGKGFAAINTGTQISISSTFGGKPTPYDY